ncbi:hypothetical protein Ahy_A07g037351 [Arachis hypogaea]|uniref:Uncharacterized protein n=1 Tax=Arachis hypogaea TaxID=3818 RepID=A0A445CIH1_ARAHY|nr:hypothetical protein Ahy_A07g037348 [Arachis hypogaea]RYR50725.1 hypothetical protein Ahy_A07g037351 [Arachis hypogaea]
MIHAGIPSEKTYSIKTIGPVRYGPKSEWSGPKDTILCGGKFAWWTGGRRMQMEEEHVMSEVHLGCPPGLSDPHNSTFTVPFVLFHFHSAKNYMS